MNKSAAAAELYLNWPQCVKSIWRFVREEIQEETREETRFGLTNYLGGFSQDFTVVVISTSEESEVCAVGYKTVKDAENDLTEQGGDWIPQQVWVGDKKKAFSVKVIIEV